MAASQRPRGSVSCVEGPGDTSAGHPAAPAVAGRWELLECRSVDDDEAATGRPLGEHPRGLVIYTPGGWMSGQLAATSRPAVESADPLRGPPDQRAAAYSTYVAYWGRYAITGDRIIHHVHSSLVPGWAGTEQVRYFSLSGDTLVLRTTPMQLAGAITVSELIWRRAESW
jgi:Lipocalin-like domain